LYYFLLHGIFFKESEKGLVELLAEKGRSMVKAGNKNKLKEVAPSEPIPSKQKHKLSIDLTASEYRELLLLRNTVEKEALERGGLDFNIAIGVVVRAALVKIRSVDPKALLEVIDGLVNQKDSHD
jgi:hypothetical protein